MNTIPATQAPKPKTAIDMVKDRLYSADMKSALQTVMPKVGSIDRFMALALQSVKLNLKNIADLDYNSVLVGVYDAAKCGLELNPTLGEAYLLPFKVSYKAKNGEKKKKTVVVFCPGYKGLIKMTRRAGTKDVQSTVVYENDLWEYFEDEFGPHPKYAPTYDKEKGRPICVYVRAILEDGTRKVMVIPWHKVAKIKEQSDKRNHETGPWQTHQEEMGEKTGIRRICKTLPQEAISAEALGIDETISELNKIPVRTAPAELENVLDADYTEMTDALAEQQEGDSGRTPMEEPKSKEELEQAAQKSNPEEKPVPTPEAATSAAPTETQGKPVQAAAEAPKETVTTPETQAKTAESGGEAPELELKPPIRPQDPNQPEPSKETAGQYQVTAMSLMKALNWDFERMKAELGNKFGVETLIQIPIKHRPAVLGYLRECLAKK
jgi:recombination protein RecT